MADSRTEAVLGQLSRWLDETRTSQDDCRLLERFVAQRDEDAFAELMARHGPLVFGLCRRMLGNVQDAEDVFQATFLVLARKAATIRKPESLSCWLHGVAYRLALKTKNEANRRRLHEQQAVPLPNSVESDLSWGEIRGAIDEELQRLPEKQRLPLVLCYLEGLTQDEAARRLDWPRGTLKRRLETGRERLRVRLTQRGITLGTGLFAVALTESASRGAISLTLRLATVKAAVSFISGDAGTMAATHAALLAQGALQTMLTTKLKIASVVMLLLVCAGFGASQLSRPLSTRHTDSADKEADRPKESADKAKVVDEVQADLRAMRGTWTSEDIETKFINGEPQAPRRRKITFVVSDGKLIQLGEDGFIDEEWTLRLDPTRKPKAIDLISHRYGTLLGIYQMEGDCLKIRYLAEEGKRPMGFSTQLEPEWALWNLKRTSRSLAKTVARFPNAPGCFWMIEPTTPPSSMATLGIVFIYERERDGAAFITLAAALRGLIPPEYRPVLLDAEGKRYLPTSATGGGGTSGRMGGPIVVLSRWRMDPKALPADKVAHIGIEAMTPEYHRITARAALERARKVGIEVLSCPEIGKPIDFDFTTTDGKRVRSRDLRGKVILIDCWATWCSPCRALLPELKDLYDKSHKDGLEIIGVSFDQDAAKFKKTCEKEELTWAQVLVPSDEKTRRLWEEITGIGGIPRLFLIDRQGVLRADNPAKLKEEIARLLKYTTGKTK